MRDALRFGVLAAAVLAARSGAAAQADPAAVLPKLHETNQKEIAAGKLAQQSGESPEMKAYGKMLVTDHTASDKKVAALARREHVALDTRSGSPDMSSMPSGPDLDRKLAKQMVAEHQQTIVEVTDARDQTDDPQLRELLTDLLPVLERHEQAAKKIVDAEAKK